MRTISDGRWSVGHLDGSNVIIKQVVFDGTSVFTPADGSEVIIEPLHFEKAAPAQVELITCTFHHEEVREGVGGFVADGTVIAYLIGQ